MKVLLWVRNTIVLGLLTCLILSCSPAGEDTAGIDLRRLIPADSVAVDIMTLSAPPRFFELSQKLQTAMQQNPIWFSSYRASVPRDKPLPYNSKMGMTEAEYNEYSLLMSQLAMQKTGNATLFVRRQDSVYDFSTRDSAIAGIDGIKINLSDDRVTTPFGVALQHSEIDNEGIDAPTGPWRGVQWALQMRDITSRKIVRVKFAIGRLAESGRGIIYYNAARVDSTGGGDQILYVLYYDLD